MATADALPLLSAATRAALDKKAFQMVVLEVAELSSYADHFIICSAASERQVGAIADEVQIQLKGLGRRPLHVEGSSRSDWVLLDYGELVMHVFTEEKRAYYNLDSLWGDAEHLDPGALAGGDAAAGDAR